MVCSIAMKSLMHSTQALKLLMTGLQQSNPKGYLQAVCTADAQSYKAGRTLAQTGVCDSNDVKYVTDNGSKIAYIQGILLHEGGQLVF